MHFTVAPDFRLPQLAAIALMLALVSGCATTGGGPSDMAPDSAPEIAPQEMNFLSGDGGAALSWEAVVARAQAADIVVLAEQHDDAVGHRFQAALVTALVDAGPVAVCLEMFERNEQPFVDAYLADQISQKTLVSVTDSMDWGAKGMWDTFYQPMVDAAKAGGSPVVAANAPRHFTRLARLESFDGLAAFSAAYPGQYVVPGAIEQADYAARFKETMSEHSAPAAPGKKGKKAAASSGMPPMTDEMVESFFRAQQVWDATMADSVVRAFEEHGKAVLAVGQFHTDHDGGLLRRMKAAKPEATYLTISVQAEPGHALREEDAGRADVVVFRP